MSEPLSEIRRRQWSMEHAQYYPLSPAELYVMLLISHIPGWMSMSDDVRQITLGAWFQADSVKDQADLVKLQQIVIGDYRKEYDRIRTLVNETDEGQAGE